MVAEKEPYLTLARVVVGFFKTATAALVGAKNKAQKRLDSWMKLKAEEERRRRMGEAEAASVQADAEAAAAKALEDARMTPQAEKMLDQAQLTEQASAMGPHNRSTGASGAPRAVAGGNRRNRQLEDSMGW